MAVRMNDRVRHPLRLQAGYYLLTGLWPLVHMTSFEAVTGPKTDDWLVQMVALLVVVIGTTIGWGVRRAREVVAPETVLLALLSAASFTGIDLVHALAGRISPIYLADAGVEIVLMLWIAQALRR
jgi:hypothetical protein